MTVCGQNHCLWRARLNSPSPFLESGDTPGGLRHWRRGKSECLLFPSRGGSGWEWGIVSGRSPRKDRGIRGNSSDPRQPPVTLGGRKGREGRGRTLLRLVTNFFFKRESLSFTLPFTHPISSVQGKRGNPGLAGVHPETPVSATPHEGLYSQNSRFPSRVILTTVHNSGDKYVHKPVENFVAGKQRNAQDRRSGVREYLGSVAREN